MKRYGQVTALLDLCVFQDVRVDVPPSVAGVAGGRGGRGWRAGVALGVVGAALGVVGVARATPRTAIFALLP